MPRSARKTADIIPLPKSTTHVTISPPNFQQAMVRIRGKTPLVMNKMSSANRKAMMDKQEQGSRSRKGQIRPPKDFDKIFKGAMHVSEQGWFGFPASAFRSAMVSACRTVGFKMTVAKLSLFVIADGIDADDGQPLVRLHGKAPVRRDLAVRLSDGSTDILPRPFFYDWHIDLRLEWDADQFGATDVMNLLARVGRQVGIGAGRHDSRQSTGMGWGEFVIEGQSK